MVVTNDSALAERCKSLRNLCFDNKRRFYHEELGWNYRITNLQAALGVAQLKKLGEHVDKKKNMGKLYRQLLCDFDEIELPPDDTEYAENIYWVFGVMLRDHISYTSSEMIAKLGEAGVGARTFFWPMHEQPVFRKKGLFLEEHYPFSEKMARKGFYLPSGLGLSEKQQYEVVDRLKNSFL